MTAEPDLTPVSVLHGDCRQIMPPLGPFDLIIADPPYGDTSLSWDRRVMGWENLAAQSLKPSGSMWVFGSMRFFIDLGQRFTQAGLKYAQDVVWEKQNGSSFHADRFKRVHEHAVQFYRRESAWSDVYNDVQKTLDATARTVRRKKRPPHMGSINPGSYASHDGGPRLMRSVIYMRNCHGTAIHPTEKPSALLELLVKTSCPSGGIVADWFAGSGAAGEACAIVGRRYVGCDDDAAAVASANQRLGSTLFTAAAQ